jgi:hypothetical protein
MKEGVYEIGFAGTGFCFDNELGRHKVYLQEFNISKNWNCNRLLEGIFRQLLFFVGINFPSGRGYGNPMPNASFSCYTIPRYTQK